MPVESRRARRIRVLVQAGLPVVVGALLLARGRRLAGPVLIGIGVALLLTGLISPRLFARWQVLIRFLARGVGIVVTWLLLVPFFYLVFLPGRLILRLARRDPLHRAWPTRATTYWSDHPPAPPDTYTRLF